MEQNNKSLKTTLTVIGSILFLIGVFWARAGFHMNQAPLLILIFVAAGILLFIAAKIKVVKDNDKGLPLSEKWKCSCGSYNDKDATVCWNCGTKKLVP